MTDTIPPGNQALAQLKIKDDSEHAQGEMTEKQAAQLRELCKHNDEPFDASLTQEQAAARIEALENR